MGVGQAAAHPRVLLDQPGREDEQVGVVERRHGPLALGVAVGDGPQVVEAVRQARVALEDDVVEGAPRLGRQGGEAHDRRRPGQRRAGLAALEDGLARERRQLGLVLAVEDRERRRHADQRAVAVQQPPADRMEGPRRERAQVGAGEACGAVDHLARGPPRERDQHDRLGGRAGLDQVGERRHDRARLPRPRRREHEGPAAGALDGGELLGVEHRPQPLGDPLPAAPAAGAGRRGAPPGSAASGSRGARASRPAFWASMWGAVGGAVCQRG